MSFMCGFCGEAQPPGTKPTMVPTKIRRGEGKPRILDLATVDYRYPIEIVEEKRACPSCERKHRYLKPEVVGFI